MKLKLADRPHQLSLVGISSDKGVLSCPQGRRGRCPDASQYDPASRVSFQLARSPVRLLILIQRQRGRRSPRAG